MNIPKKELHKFFFEALKLLVKVNCNFKLEDTIFNPIMLKEDERMEKPVAYYKAKPKVNTMSLLI